MTVGHCPVVVNKSNKKPLKQVKLRWDKADLDAYYWETWQRVSSINFNAISEITAEDMSDSSTKIDTYCAQIIEALVSATEGIVPKTSSDFFKHWWDDELKDLKQKSLDAHQLWIACGKPKNGDIFRLKQQCKAQYKLAIKQKRTANDRHISNDLNDFLMMKDYSSFWETWKAKFTTHTTVSGIVDGASDSTVVANKFADVFKLACSNNSVIQNNNLFSEFSVAYDMYCKDQVCYEISAEVVALCVSKLKLGKASGLDGVEAEHILHAHPLLIVHLCTLFNAILRCGYVPNCFGKGIIIPLVKDKSADITDINNYRGITLSSVISKLFEMCLVEVFSDHLQTSDLQFGFKKQLGCANAIYALSSVIEYFTKNGSTINACFLDVSKAFDKVNHYGLYLKLIKRGIPLMLLNVIINWYGKCSAVVRWESCYSRCFPVTCGVRQGGVLSPFLFAIYVDAQ